MECSKAGNLSFLNYCVLGGNTRISRRVHNVHGCAAGGRRRESLKRDEKFQGGNKGFRHTLLRFKTEAEDNRGGKHLTRKIIWLQPKKTGLLDNGDITQ